MPIDLVNQFPVIYTKELEMCKMFLLFFFLPQRFFYTQIFGFVYLKY